MVFCKEVVEIDAVMKEESELLIAQSFYESSNKNKHGSQSIKAVSQFEKGVFYGSRVAITNTGESESEINVLTEVPQGSIPYPRRDYFLSTTLDLKPLKTEIIEFSFYFPYSGEFTVYPASITRDTDLIATANINKTVQV